MRSLNADISNVDYCGTMHHSVTQAKAEQETKEGKKGRKKEKNGLRKLKTPKKKGSKWSLICNMCLFMLLI